MQQFPYFIFIIKMYFIKYLLFVSSIQVCTIIKGDILVNTTHGPIRGIQTHTQTQQKIPFFAFQGIPYAEPPIGNLRFRPPKWGKQWTKIYNATSERSVCTQTQNNTVLGSENCLFLNVYTPQIKINDTRATIVWIHGGAFNFGSGNLGLNGADYFIASGVILVSINYRLGVFGFLSTQDASSPGNWGLKDQILALKWLQKNIKNFGGDPKNITIMGESAGSASVNYLIQSSRAKNLFKGAIAESGSSLNPWSCGCNARQLAFRIGLINLIITLDSKTLVEGLRKINATNLQKSITIPAILKLLDPLNGLPFAPVMEDKDVPDAVYIKSSYESRKRGFFNRVPLLNGFNSMEARTAKNLPWYGLLLLPQYNLDSSNLTPKDMNASRQGKQIVGDKIKSVYFKNHTISDGINLINFLNDNEFIRGIVKTSQFHSKYAKCYLYQFSFIGSVMHEAFNPEGVPHAEELQFLFKDPSWRQNTSLAKLTVKRMVTFWSNFAKFGDPTPHLSKIINVKWPLVNASENIHYLDINSKLVAKINPHETQMKLWDKWYNDYGYEPFNTY